VHRHRRRADRSQPAGRHRLRRVVVRVPRPVGTDPRPRQHPPGDRGDHARHHPAQRRDRLRGGAAHRPGAGDEGGGRSDAPHGRGRGSPTGGGRLMALTAPHAPSALVQPAARVRAAAQRVTRRHLILAGVGVLLLLSIVRYVADANDLTSSGAFEQALKSAVPILLAGLGGLYAERCGVVNIGLEGMMILGTWFGAWGGWMWGPWWGVVAGVLGGAVGGLIHAVATVTFNVDHIVSGVAINILGAGVARF